MSHNLTVKITTTNLCDTFYPLNMVNSNFEPLIGYNYSSHKNYTIIMIDNNAVNLLNPFLSYTFLHFLKVNNTVVLNKYLPPAPKNNKIHNYTFLLYQQKYSIPNISPIIRENFNLTQFVKKYHLKLKATLNFQTANNII